MSRISMSRIGASRIGASQIGMGRISKGRISIRRISMRRRLARLAVILLAFAVTLGGLVFAGTEVINAIERPTSTTTSSMQVGAVTRSWVTILPSAPLPKSAPIIVVLSGVAASTSQEINRDDFLPYADADKAELVYPVSIQESWNAGGCCGYSGSHNVDDLAFMEALVPKIDPGHVRPLYLVGYSNGGRLAYDVACHDPGLYDAIAVAKADPMPGCVVSKAQNFIQLDSLDDPWVPYLPGQTGKESPAATVQIANLETAFDCGSTSDVLKQGNMTETTWTKCADNARLAFAVWTTGGHNFPEPPKDYPTGAAVIYAFFTRTAIAPVPGQAPPK
jgi:polyhydroxybutyrate depolymerase